MTLLATFKIDDTPVLITDLMVSWEIGHQNDNANFPAINPQHEAYVNSLNLQFSHKRKIAKINDTFILGYCGNVSFACKIISALRQEYRQTEVTKDCLKAFLKPYKTTEDHKHVGLTGWMIVDGQPISFGWYSYTPILLDFGQNFYQMGSMPEDKLQQCVFQDQPVGGVHEHNPKTGEATIEELHDQEMSIRGHLCGIVSSLYETIVGDKTSYKDRYGFGFEAVYFTEGEFRFLNDLEFNFWECLENKEMTDLDIYGVENVLRTTYIDSEPYLLQCKNFPVEGRYANDGGDSIKVFKALDIEKNEQGGLMNIEQLETVMNKRYNAVYLWQIQTGCGKRGNKKFVLLAESPRVFTFGMENRQIVSHVNKTLFDSFFLSRINEATELFRSKH